jgi:ribonuclease HI
MILEIYCDGSAQPNPGPSGYGIVVLKNGVKAVEIYEYLGYGTNQIAEMIALR